MGMMHINAYHNQMLLLNTGDVLVVGTDGFSEARNAHREIFGFERLIRLTEHTASRSAEEIAQAWFEAVDTFEAGYPQDDDQTLIVIKVQ
jgi:sigma-B regulation protein RsbU (phosphoserine phosphatase)